MTARLARRIRRRCQRNSHCREHCGVSELFLAPPQEAAVILAARDLRLLSWLLGFTDVPASPGGYQNASSRHGGRRKTSCFPTRGIMRFVGPSPHKRSVRHWGEQPRP